MKPNELCVSSLHREVKNVFFERYCIIIAEVCVYVHMRIWDNDFIQNSAPQGDEAADAQMC